ncbi:MAG TPA: hypothetical protein VK603_21540, partial [Candidatus Saccharimonadales bacterium]|nr:hypothetical protein [Candidatus Saccharimonadales bacterium]
MKEKVWNVAEPLPEDITDKDPSSARITRASSSEVDPPVENMRINIRRQGDIKVIPFKGKCSARPRARTVEIPTIAAAISRIPLAGSILTTLRAEPL